VIQALIIVFREVLEAGLIIGIVLAASKSVAGRGRWVALGIGCGLLGACAVAALAGVIGGLFHGSGQELLNAGVLFTAVAMLAWHNVWMSTHGREMAKEANQLGREVASGDKSLIALTIVVAIAVLREGSEVVLFLYGVVASGEEPWQSIAGGGVGGLLLGAASSALIYLGLLSIPVRHFFTATTVLITFLAAGLAEQGIAFLQQAGILEVWSNPVWNTSELLPESGWVGRVLHVLIGYSDQPSGMQVTAYAVTLGGIFLLMKYAAKAHLKTQNA
jgi:high-affinity iron transporter